MSRMTFLAAAAAVALTGCGGNEGVSTAPATPAPAAGADAARTDAAPVTAPAIVVAPATLKAYPDDGRPADRPADRPANGREEDRTRRLTVTAPGEQTVTRDQAAEFGVSVDRDNFAGPIAIRVTGLPAGVSVITKEMTIPAGRDSLRVTIKAGPDAPVVDDHVARVTATADGMPPAEATFQVDVRTKN